MYIYDEKFKLCDLISVNLNNGKNLYKAIVYSTLLQQTTEVYITQEQFEFLLTMGDNVDANLYFERTFNSFKKVFQISYKK